MFATQHGGDSGPNAPATEAAEGLHEDSHGVMRLIVDGFGTDAGKTTYWGIQRVVTKVEEGEIEWERIHIPRLRLFNNSHLLLIQGMAPAQLFLASSLLLPDGMEKASPLLYICGRASDAWVQPCRVTNLVLAKLVQCPNNMLLSAVSLALFQNEMEGYFSGMH